MIKKKFSLVIIFLFLMIKPILSKEVIVFINIDKVINSSDIGKKLNADFDNQFKKQEKKFLDLEKNLLNKEKDIIKQKNVLNETEYKSKVSSLRAEIKKFQLDKSNNTKKFRKLKLDQTNALVNKLNKILSKYAEENEISLIIQKKNIVIGKSNLDITEKIMSIFNAEVKSLN